MDPSIEVMQKRRLSIGTLARNLLYKPAPVIERRGEDFFIPAHPDPRVKEPGLLQILLGARYSLIDNWMFDSYHSGIETFQILKRQVVLVNSPQDIRYVLVTRHENFDRKSPQMRRALEMLLGDGLFISDGKTWAQRRPLVADIVHKKRIPEFASTMEEVIEGFLGRWDNLVDQGEFNIAPEMSYLTAEIIARTVFGRDLGAKAAKQVTQGFMDYQSTIDSFNLAYFAGVDEGFPLFPWPSRRRAVELVHKVVSGVIEDHLNGATKSGSMIDLLLERQRRNPELQLDVKALRNEAATIFMAGHETTATTLTWAFYLIANAPWIEDKIQEEIGHICGERPVTMDDIAKLDWCRAVILETLRLYPPVPLLPRQAREADQIGSIPIEKGALIMIAPWLLHRARDLWTKPNEFLPERFIENPKVDPFAYLPFSAGPRICAGLNFGRDEAVLCLASLLQRFIIRPQPNYEVRPVCRLTLRPLGGLPVTITPRRALR